MSDQDLSGMLDELRAAIAATEGLADDDRGRLDEMVRRIESNEDEDEEDDGVIEQINDALSRFEADHVDLVSAINRVANVLSAGGI